MIRVFFICCCLCAATTGCIPYAGVFHPISDPKNLKTAVLDSETGQQIKDAKAILILHRSSASLPDARSEPKHPKVVVDKFSNLPKLGYMEGGLWVWPFAAFGTQYSVGEIFIYKDGYKPEPLKHKWVNKHASYPETILMYPCNQKDGREMLITNALQVIGDEEWKADARRELEQKLQ